VTDNLFLLFAVFVLLAGALAIIAVRAPRRLAVKAAAVATAALFIPTAYAGLTDLLSRPKPVALEWVKRHAAEATILGSLIREGDGIYLWLQTPDGPEPRAYVLPWDRKVAQQLQDARRAAERQRTGLRMRRPFRASLDEREALFYAEPQPPQPEKRPPADATLMYRPPAG
jgi:hypothetical protein